MKKYSKKIDGQRTINEWSAEYPSDYATSPFLWDLKNDGESLLHCAVRFENEALTRMILEKTKIIDAPNDKKETPLDIAVCENLNVEIAELLF